MIRLPKRNDQLPASFQTRRVTAGGLRLNFGSSLQALGALSDAVGNGPRYREQDVSSGVIRLAEAIGGSVEKVAQLRMANQDITDKRKLFRAETEMQVGMAELDGLLANEKDPNKWEEIANNHMQAVRQRVDMEGVSPRAIEAFDQYAERNAVVTVARARNNGFRANEKMMMDEAFYRVDNAVQNKDMPAAITHLQTLKNGGHIGPEEFNNRVLDAADKIRAARKADLRQGVTNALNQPIPDFKRAEALVYAASEDLTPAEIEAYDIERMNAQAKFEYGSMAAEDPQKFLELIQTGKFTQMNELDKQYWTEVAYNNMQAVSAVTADKASRAMERGLITKPEDMDKPEWSKLTPGTRKAYKEVLEKGKPNDANEWGQVANLITHTTLTGDAAKDQLRLSDLRNMVDLRFKGHYADGLKQLIDDLEQSTQEGPGGTDFAKQIVTQAFADGQLGKYEVEYVAEKKPIWTPFGTFGGQAGTPLAPNDEASKPKPGDKVVDIRAREQAQTVAQGLLKMLDAMKKAGKSAEEREKFARDSVLKFRLGPALQTTEQTGTPSLLPSGSNTDPALWDANRKTAEQILNGL